MTETTATLSLPDDAPLLVFGGPYSNLQALEALLADAARRGIPPRHMLCTGDVVAYGGDPEACVDLIRRHGIATVMGNCEEQLAGGAGDCGCGFAPGSACDRLAAAWYAHADARIDADARRWMGALPRRIDVAIGGLRLAAVHGAPSRINRFLFASDPDAWFAAEIAATGAEGVLAGHSGIGFARRIGERLWVNAGAIGLPANDGTPRGWFAILTPTANGLHIAHLPLAYDHRGAARSMRAACLPEDYADALETGIWPSFDILPQREQAATGTPIVPRETVFPGAGAAPPEPTPAPATVGLERLQTLWINTGTRCNIECAGCYIESGPRNDRLAYLPFAEFARLLDEASSSHPDLAEIGFTGGEPFLNRDTPAMIEAALDRGCRALVLTNAMRPMQRQLPTLGRLRERHGGRLALRVSLDGCTREAHERLRGRHSFAPAMDGLRALCALGIAPSVAARFDPDAATEADVRAGFAALFAREGLAIDAHDPDALVLFPEMTRPVEVDAVPAAAWRAMRRRGRDAMCRTSRMIVLRKGAARASVTACTLLPYEPRFDLGTSLADATGPVTLDHRHCAAFCVFGGASCSAAR